MAETARSLAVKAAAAKVPASRGVAPTLQRAGDRRIYTFRVPGPAPSGRLPAVQLVKVTVGPAGDVIKVLVSRS